MKQQGNQRLPLLSLQNRKVKNENSNMNKGNKNTDQNCNIFNIYNPYSVPMETDDNKHMNANLMSVKPLSVNGKSDVRMQISEKEDSSVGEVQYNKVLGKALQEAIDENDYVSKILFWNIFLNFKLIYIDLLIFSLEKE